MRSYLPVICLLSVVCLYLIIASVPITPLVKIKDFLTYTPPPHHISIPMMTMEGLEMHLKSLWVFFIALNDLQPVTDSPSHTVTETWTREGDEHDGERRGRMNGTRFELLHQI